MTGKRCALRIGLIVGVAAAVTLCAPRKLPAQEAPVSDAAPVAPAPVLSAPTATASHANRSAETPVRLWKGEAEAGVIDTNGNSNSESVRARIKLQYEPAPWKHTLTGDFVRIAEQGITTTEQFSGALKSDRDLSRRSYLFASARYETDRFAGYSPRVAESAGYGRKFPFNKRVRLEAEAGAGGRHTWATDGTRKSEAIVRIASRFFWAFGAQSEFSEEAFSEFGDENVHTESQTSLKTKINADFSMKVNVTMKHDTVVAAGRHKTDTITSLTLVYDL